MQFVYPPVTIDTAGLATEATLLQVETNTADTVTEIQTLTSTVLTDTQLRATPVPVSGPLTDAQLRATAVPVSAASLPLPANAAQENTLQSAVNELITISSTDFATESTLSSIQNTSNNIQTAVDALNARIAGSLAPVEFDEQVISYVVAGNGAGEIFQIVYKLATVTVLTVTLSYDSSDRVTGVVAS